MNVDMWYGDKLGDVTRIDVMWSDLDCIYRGNIYIGNKVVGDYTAKRVQSIQRVFPQLKFI